VPDSYVPPSHPFYNPKVKQYAYDPQAASALLETIGWKDHDGNPATPRLAQGVASIQDGTPFEFAFLTTDDQEKQNVAQIIQESLAQCGVGVRVESRPWEELFAPGPVGPVFSRNFSMAQFGWATALEPPCFLYATWEIPGPYPEFPKGWGGANASGFSQVGFDQACQQALFSLADMPEHRSAHDQAQEIFADELPAIPLYLRTRIVVTRPDMCAIVVDPSADSVLWNVESFNYGETCPQ
jgi:peptide/nickel transport system substrate-binding protein